MVNTYCVAKCEYALPSYYPDFAFLRVHSELKVKLSAYRKLGAALSYSQHAGCLFFQLSWGILFSRVVRRQRRGLCEAPLSI